MVRRKRKLVAPPKTLEAKFMRAAEAEAKAQDRFFVAYRKSTVAFDRWKRAEQATRRYQRRYLDEQAFEAMGDSHVQCACGHIKWTHVVDGIVIGCTRKDCSCKEYKATNQTADVQADVAEQRERLKS